MDSGIKERYEKIHNYYNNEFSLIMGILKTATKNQWQENLFCNMYLIYKDYYESES